MASGKQKRLAGKLCCYCVDNPATVEDHVVSRKFFPNRLRGDLPQVPACVACNTRKSAFELYCQTVLLFGLDDPVQWEQMQAELPGRFKQNQKLLRQIRSNLREEYVRLSSGIIVPTGVLSVDINQIRPLFEMMARGFYYVEEKKEMSTSTLVKGIYLRQDHWLILKSLTMSTSNTVRRVYAGGQFDYLYAKFPEVPELTIWSMKIFNSYSICVITAPFSYAVSRPKLRAMFQSQQATHTEVETEDGFRLTPNGVYAPYWTTQQKNEK